MTQNLLSAAPHELAAILSGLRMLQSEMNADGDQFLAGDTLTDGGAVTPISPEEIDTLCENLNADAPRFFIVEHLSFLASLSDESYTDKTLLFWTGKTWGDLRSAKSYSVKDLLTYRLPVGADVRWIPVDDLAGDRYSGLFKTRADLFSTPAFVWLLEDSEKNPCVWENHYHCTECSTDWTDFWSCQCDDECPQCGHDHPPEKSTWAGPSERQWIELWNSLPEA